ncbi:DNA excision repair protein ERCC-8-like [Clavelina lepadiformis]|uniref:DNA excision repair protein ERCC-8 n=1 Tax=Clavelina lepadiformis TaxID=159417 RepID=A0ABP0GCY8_CLALP
MSFLPLLQACQIGECHPRFFRTVIEHKQILSLVATDKEIQHNNVASTSAMELDPVDFRYLIAVGAQRKITIHNTWTSSDCSISCLPEVASVDGQRKHQHKKTINYVQWYPHDTGMFVTSAFDGTIKIWDTNHMKPVETMDIKHAVYNHHISPISASHSLIAAASSVHVRLADMRTGSTAHLLKGHRDNVLYVKWSPKDEFLLATGSEDGRLLMWDVRQAKAILLSLDQHNGDIGGNDARGTKAHSGSVNSLLFNEDGRYLLSFGSDERMRLWNCESGANTLVNYGRIDNNSIHRPLHMAIHHSGASASVVFVPAGRQVFLCDLYTGSCLGRLSEHFSQVRCCEHNKNTLDLFTAAEKSKILIWSPEIAIADNSGIDEAKFETGRNGTSETDRVSRLLQDTWSDSD